MFLYMMEFRIGNVSFYRNNSGEWFGEDPDGYAFVGEKIEVDWVVEDLERTFKKGIRREVEMFFTPVEKEGEER
jgi:hypothetical protein